MRSRFSYTATNSRPVSAPAAVPEITAKFSHPGSTVWSGAQSREALAAARGVAAASAAAGAQGRLSSQMVQGWVEPIASTPVTPALP